MVLKRVLCFHLDYVKWMAKSISLTTQSITSTRSRFQGGVTLALGKEDEADQSDGPSGSAPVGYICTRCGLYVAEQLSTIQGAIRMVRFYKVSLDFNGIARYQ